MIMPYIISEPEKIVPRIASKNLFVCFAIATIPKTKPGIEQIKPYVKAKPAREPRSVLYLYADVEIILASIINNAKIEIEMQPAANATIAKAFAAPPPETGCL